MSIGALTALGACTFGAGPNHSGAEAPDVSDVSSRLPAGQPWALVLSSGGPRGFVHIGVIEALDDIGVKPDMVVGASIGALVGTLYCGGLSGKQMRQIAMELSPTQIASLAIGTRERFSGKPIAHQVNYHLRHQLLQSLEPVCVVVAREQNSNRVVGFTEGNAGTAVQASTAIEGQFTPVTIRQKVFVDPDKVMPLPVRLARRIGAARVLSVDASAHEERAPEGAQRYRESDRLKRALTRPDAQDADLNLHPDFGYWFGLSNAYRERCMHSGYQDTMRAADKIKRLAAG